MKKYKIYVMVTLIILGCAFLKVSYGFTEESDPLVTQSYVEMRVEQVKAYFDDKFTNINEELKNIKNQLSSVQNGNNSGTGGSIFEPVTVKAGKIFIGGAGTEVILRVGNAKAITTKEGGIVDATGGIDIANGKDIPKQHLLIIPRNDGRGFSISTKGDAVIMVKGSYQIQ